MEYHMTLPDTHDVLNHLAEYVKVTLRGRSASSSNRGLTPIVLTLALITWREGRENRCGSRGSTAATNLVFIILEREEEVCPQ